MYHLYLILANYYEKQVIKVSLITHNAEIWGSISPPPPHKVLHLLFPNRQSAGDAYTVYIPLQGLYNEHCITIALDFFRMTMALIQQIGLYSQDMCDESIGLAVVDVIRAH
jgi:hypothetical protein